MVQGIDPSREGEGANVEDRFLIEHLLANPGRLGSYRLEPEVWAERGPASLEAVDDSKPLLVSSSRLHAILTPLVGDSLGGDPS